MIYPEVESAKKSYASTFATTCCEQPFNQAKKMLWFRYQTLKNNWRLAPYRRIAKAREESVVPVPLTLQPPSYKYRGYQGPWIEEVVYQYWLKNRIQSHFSYLPIFFDGFFMRAQTQSYFPTEFGQIYQQMRDLWRESIKPDQLYFTVLGMYDFPIWNWQEFPKNVLVFAANGHGDIPIPLLKGDLAFETPTKDIFISFMGKLDGLSDYNDVRSRMHAVLKNDAYFGEGKDWFDIMRRSTFSLCPRGMGRTSFRLYEALSVCSIPIYIWDEAEWLPYQDILDWSEISIRVNARDIEQIPELIKAHTKADIEKKQQRIAELYPKLFTFEAVCQNIVRTLGHYRSLEDVDQLTSQRNFT